jgi:thiol-disulfide isomerase/thioredoxin
MKTLAIIREPLVHQFGRRDCLERIRRLSCIWTFVGVGAFSVAAAEQLAIAPASTARAVADSSASAKPAKTDPATLVGRGVPEVQAMLGKPMGKLQTGQGALWLYADWKIQFDRNDQVLKVEKDAPVRLSQPTAQYLAISDAIEKAERERAAENYAARVQANATTETGTVRIISNRGERVDLPSLLAEGKVTIVDFFAPWCGPCRQISPVLEKIARDDPNIALLKIDIVNWGTPVATQFGLQAIPNIRVFDRNKNPVGNPASDIGTVVANVKQAKGS